MPTINGVNYTPFKEEKNATKLGIDLSRKFIVVEKSKWSPQVGDILEIREDDYSNAPIFWNLTRDSYGRGNKHETENKWECTAYWSQLAYYDEPVEVKQYYTIEPVTSREELIAITANGVILKNKLNFTPPICHKPIAKGNKIMSIITNAFKSKEDKALEYFNLGDSKQLNEEGRREFVNYVFEIGDTTKKGFLAKMVEAYKEEKK